MAEDTEQYGDDKSQLLFIAKRLSDIAKDLDGLSEYDKQFVVERVDKVNAVGMVALYNALLEYME